jgi:hypothetical protein
MYSFLGQNQAQKCSKSERSNSTVGIFQAMGSKHQTVFKKKIVQGPKKD